LDDRLRRLCALVTALRDGEYFAAPPPKRDDQERHLIGLTLLDLMTEMVERPIPRPECEGDDLLTNLAITDT
jgi:hypothetical protein